jgi:transcriptional regulator with XRE-family HTH domain
VPKSGKFANMTIGKRIAQLRSKKGLSMNQLAKQCGIAQSRMSYYESDAQLPGIEILKSIATALEVPLSHLVYGEDMSELQKLVPVVEKLPESVQVKIREYIKDQIHLLRHQELDRQLAKELE